MTISGRSVPTVDDVRFMPQRGPWETKSRGQLMVTLALPIPVLNTHFLFYDPEELASVLPFDIRGLRLYTVRGLPENSIGGTEFHRIREEMVFVLDGLVLWTCEDLAGNIRELLLDPTTGVWMPPYILHTYQALKPDSGLLVIANTLFDPEDPSTHDTYPADSFHQLQAAKH